MFIGHYAVGLAAKRAAPRLSLGTLFVAVQLLDLIWPILVLSGIEHVRIDPGNTAFTPLDFYDYPITHSLVGSLGWAIALSLAHFGLRRDRRGAAVLGLGVVSHWVLDFVAHRADLPLFPGGPKVGLGLWNTVVGSAVVELGLFAAGLMIYLRTTNSRDRVGRYAFWALIGFLLLTWTANLLGPPPPNAQVVAVSALALWLLVPWAAWADRHRNLPRLHTAV